MTGKATQNRDCRKYVECAPKGGQLQRTDGPHGGSGWEVEAPPGPERQETEKETERETETRDRQRERDREYH